MNQAISTRTTSAPVRSLASETLETPDEAVKNDLAAQRRLTRAVAKALDCIAEVRRSGGEPDYLIVVKSDVDFVVERIDQDQISRTMSDYLARGLRKDTAYLRSALAEMRQDLSALPGPGPGSTLAA